jgi:hypothetical protein
MFHMRNLTFQFLGRLKSNLSLDNYAALCNRSEETVHAFSILKDTVGKRAKRDKMEGGGWHVSKNSIPLADARRNRTDREEAVGGE